MSGDERFDAVDYLHCFADDEAACIPSASQTIHSIAESLERTEGDLAVAVAEAQRARAELSKAEADFTQAFDRAVEANNESVRLRQRLDEMDAAVVDIRRTATHEIARLQQQRKAALDEAAHWLARAPSWREAARRLRVALGEESG